MKTYTKKIAAFLMIVLLFFVIELFEKIFFASVNFSQLMLLCTIVIILFFYLIFELKEYSAEKMAIIATLTALSIAGRLVFTAFPGFKPCTAIAIITGIYLGPLSGFMVGSLTALVSNFFYSQGIWTLFQMLAWGLSGFLAGVFSKILSKSKIILVIFGAISGASFSIFMDFWSCIWADNEFVPSRFFTLVASSVTFTIIYMIANCIFLLLFIKPADTIFSRLKKKYDIGR